MAIYQIDFMGIDASKRSFWKTLTQLCDNFISTTEMNFWRKWLNSFQRLGQRVSDPSNHAIGRILLQGIILKKFPPIKSYDSKTNSLEN